MTLRHIRIFVEVVDQGSATAAANVLYLAQPAVLSLIHIFFLRQLIKIASIILYPFTIA